MSYLVAKSYQVRVHGVCVHGVCGGSTYIICTLVPLKFTGKTPWVMNGYLMIIVSSPDTPISRPFSVSSCLASRPYASRVKVHVCFQLTHMSSCS